MKKGTNEKKAKRGTKMKNGHEIAVKGKGPKLTGTTKLKHKR